MAPVPTNFGPLLDELSLSADGKQQQGEHRCETEATARGSSRHVPPGELTRFASVERDSIAF